MDPADHPSSHFCSDNLHFTAWPCQAAVGTSFLLRSACLLRGRHAPQEAGLLSAAPGRAPAHHTEDLSSSSPSASIVVGHYSADAFPELHITPQEALKHSFAYFVESVPWRNWGCLRTLETPVSYPSFLLPLAKVSPSLSLQRKSILGDLRLSSRACSMAVKS